MAGRFLSLFKPVSRFLPEVAPPTKKLSFRARLAWTGAVLVIYLVMCEVPLYGIPSPQGGDPFLYLRVIFASRRGSLMELGIQPIVTAGLVLQLLVASKIIECDFTNPEDRALFTAANKFFSIVLTGVNALAYIVGGVYGGLSFVNAVLVFSQLMVAGIVLILLDEMVQKGWGLGSGISLFILAGVAQSIFWNSFSPIGPVEDGLSHGAIIATAQAIATGNWKALYDRGVYPTLLGFLATIAVFMVVIYMQGMRVEIPITYARFRGFRGRYPISLLYVSNIPVIFSSALFANVYFISQILWSNYNRDGSNFWLNLLGTFTTTPNGGLRPSGGLVYYMVAPRSPSEVVGDPLRALAYLLIMVFACGLFAKIWLEIGGLDPATVARQIVDSGLQVPGFRRSYQAVKRLLERYIPTVTVLGGVIVGLLAALSDFVGVFGSGMGILLAVGIVYQYYQILVRERIEELHPGLAKLIGAG